VKTNAWLTLLYLSFLAEDFYQNDYPDEESDEDYEDRK
jgi:hypothetical protein